MVREINGARDKRSAKSTVHERDGARDKRGFYGKGIAGGSPWRLTFFLWSYMFVLSKWDLYLPCSGGNRKTRSSVDHNGEGGASVKLIADI
jgi:hypothetical protein